VSSQGSILSPLLKFPSYLADNAATLSAVDQARYKSQLECVTKVVGIFEKSTSTDQDTKAMAEVLEWMMDVSSLFLSPFSCEPTLIYK
jgi:Pex19 protein family